MADTTKTPSLKDWMKKNNVSYTYSYFTNRDGVKRQNGILNQKEVQDKYNAYLKGLSKPDPEKPDPEKPDPSKPVKPDPKPGDKDVEVVPGKPEDKNQINIADWAGDVVTNPSLAFTGDDPKTKNVNESMFLADRDKNNTIDTSKGLMNGKDKNFQMDADGLALDDPNVVKNQTKTTDPLKTNLKGTQVDADNVAIPKQPKTATYDAALTADKVAKEKLVAAKGKVSDGATIDADEVPQADMTGLATGVNKDGSVNETGKALQDYASINLSNVVDTSTSAGKLLAKKLGEGNYVDSKATLKGQLDILQSEFVGPNGEPKIPMWAAATARNVSKIAAFSGMTGTAATAAMATALMEASIPIAQQDSQFFQTLTIKNLDNKQQATLNRANVLAKFDQQNLDNRMTAAVQNAQSFLAMDLKNLDNEQQARVINNQNRVQSILEDAKAKNTARMFAAEQKNQMNLSYDQLQAKVAAENADRNLTAEQLNQQTKLAYDKMNSENAQFNAEQENFYDQLNTQISQFNSSQLFEKDKFDATMEDSREKFYKEMQYNIALSNAKWRQTVQLQEDQQKFEAATLDTKNMFDLNINQLNQLWDRSDSLLDYLWKSSESQKDREATLALNKIKIKADSKNADKTAIGQLLGTFIGSDTGGKVLSSIFDGLF